MSDWAALERELDRWGEAGQAATLWWRDDDATARTAALDRLIDLAASLSLPLAVAVIPQAAEATLAASLAGSAAGVRVLQHGFAHRNNAGPDAKKCELVAPALRPEIAGELRQGQALLAALCGERLIPALVPPWNRIDGDLVAALPSLGFTGLSTYKARRLAEPAAGLRQVNCHVDIMQWRPQRRFLGTAAALQLLVGHLEARRTGAVDAGEATGILTHHAVHDAEAWRFLEDLLPRLAGHPASRFPPPDALFAAPADRVPASSPQSVSGAA
ncbi:polysaccharide deacetylase family protein [Pelagibius sp.]|uniref:polysaccharide deacetylase family protein n=1 Tax=Pelagibius sp. TaxID=1931238 RepID=UPI002608787B|nr:polysaccharide deacetylase family protein [Pelagibius sp.]